MKTSYSWRKTNAKFCCILCWWCIWWDPVDRALATLFFWGGFIIRLIQSNQRECRRILHQLKRSENRAINTAWCEAIIEYWMMSNKQAINEGRAGLPLNTSDAFSEYHIDAYREPDERKAESRWNPGRLGASGSYLSKCIDLFNHWDGLFNTRDDRLFNSSDTLFNSCSRSRSWNT